MRTTVEEVDLLTKNPHTVKIKRNFLENRIIILLLRKKTHGLPFSVLRQTNVLNDSKKNLKLNIKEKNVYMPE